LYRVCLVADAPADAIALALPASSVQVWVAGRIVADVSRVADERCCLRLVWLAALLRVWRPARVWLAETLADDLVHAAREAALRRDSRGGIHATGGKAAFPSPFFPSQVLEERRKRKPIPAERQRTASIWLVWMHYPMEYF
jgi:hypothetical protein